MLQNDAYLPWWHGFCVADFQNKKKINQGIFRKFKGQDILPMGKKSP